LRDARAIEERVARDVPFDERGRHLTQAVDCYLRASEDPALWLEATFAAGCLLAGENSVRDPDRAIALLEEVVARGHASAHYFLGEAYVMKQRFDDAEAVWRRGLALDPDNRAIADVLRHLPADRRSVDQVTRRRRTDASPPGG
jgi:cytochrome c-type biogenesis protein CcmH/NrfG